MLFPTRRTITRAAALLLTLCGTAEAQFTTQVRFANYASFRRVEWGLATVPFPRGTWLPGQSFTARGVPSELVPFGARWPDSSVRYAQLVVPLDLGPGQEQVVDVVQGSVATPPFALSRWATRGLAKFDLKLAVTLPNRTVRVAGLQLLRIEQNTALRRTFLFRARVPNTDLVYDLWLSLLSGQDHAPFELRLTNSSTGSQRWETAVETVDLVVGGAIPLLRGANRRGVDYGRLSAVGPNVVRLLGKTKLFDGQGQEWRGDLLFYHPTGAAGEARRASTLAAVVHHPLFGVSLDWAASGAFGPFGHIPPTPPWVTDGGRAASRSQRLAYEGWVASRGGPWDNWPMGLHHNPGGPGGQPDFGAAKLLQVFASGFPDGIEEGRMNASEEACRPVHYREADGSPVRAARHPDWVTWIGRTHYSQQVSRDRLGKPYPAAPLNANAWNGRDRQHWSSLTLASAYLLTASPSLRYELENEAELFLSGHTLPSSKPGWSTNGVGAPRGVGRVDLSMAWNYLLTGRNDVAQRMRDRSREVTVKQVWSAQGIGIVRPMAINPPDPRQLNVSHWRPWEESQAVLGLEANYRVTGSIEAHAVAVVAARNLTNWGWKVTATENIIATAVGWQAGGVPLSTQQYQSPTWVLWSYNTAFSEWAVPALKLAFRYGTLYNDPALVQRANLILQRLQQARVKPRPHGGWDDFSEWNAVR